MSVAIITPTPAGEIHIYPPAAAGTVVIKPGGVKGDKGDPGDPGTGGGGSSNTYIQQTDPAIATPYIWFKTDIDGHVIDILKGGA